MVVSRVEFDLKLGKQDCTRITCLLLEYVRFLKRVVPQNQLGICKTAAIRPRTGLVLIINYVCATVRGERVRVTVRGGSVWARPRPRWRSPRQITPGMWMSGWVDASKERNVQVIAPQGLACLPGCARWGVGGTHYVTSCFATLSIISLNHLVSDYVRADRYI